MSIRISPRFRCVLVAFSAMVSGSLASSQTIPAFPGAEGAGAYAKGGRGGDVYHVTNTNPSGAGSLAYGLTTGVPAAGSTIVFDVSGYAHISGTLRVTAPKITIAGQTAPGDGFGLKDGTFLVSSDDFVVRHLRYRDGNSADSIDLDSGSLNSIFDHVDAMFSNDENMSSFGSPPENLTFQWSFNAWGMETHSCGGLWDQNHATSHHTLWAHNHTRNPKARPALLDWVNNVTFDWDIGFIMGDSDSRANWNANIRGCYFVAGTPKSTAIEKGSTTNFSLYLDDSVIDGNVNGVLDVSGSGYSLVSGAYNTLSAPLVNTGIPVTIDDHLTAYKKVVSNAGPLRLDYDPSVPLRDEVDSLLVSDLVTQLHRHVNAVSKTGLSNGGFGTLNSASPPIDTDQDGMPDYWETALGFNTTTDDHNTVFAGSGGVISTPTFFPANTAAGYTYLEEYLHFLAIPHAVLPKNTSGNPSSITIDLRKFTSGFTNTPVFTLANLVGGTAVQSGTGNYLVTFTPTANLVGRARFEFKVADADGSQWTQTFALLVSANALPRDLTWNGASNTWDSTALNWLYKGTPTTFSLGDRVTFDNTGAGNAAVSIPSAVSPATVRVNTTTTDYTLQGAGLINGVNSLTKIGSGTLRISTPNIYTGGTTLAEGTLTLAPGGLIGTGPVNFQGGTLSSTYGGTTALTVGGPLTVPAGVAALVTLSPRMNINGLTGGAGGSMTLMIPGTTFNYDNLIGAFAGFTGMLNLSGTVDNARITGNFNGGGFDGNLSNVVLNLDRIIFDGRHNSGGNTLTIGALNGTTSTQLAGSGFAGAQTIVVGGLGLSTTFAGGITNGAGGAATVFTKTGAGTLTLSGASSFTGATTISAGTLLVSGTLGNTPVTIASGATLAGSGTIGSTAGGPVTASAGAILSPGSAPLAGGTLNVGNGLTLNGATLLFDLTGSSSGANDKIVLNGGPLTLSGTQTFQFQLADGTLGAGTYPLITGGTTTAVTNAVLSSNLPTGARQTFALTRSAAGNGAASVNLVVTGTPASLLWTGAAGGTWDANATINWSGAADGNNKFVTNDAVTFDDSSTVNAVGLVGSLQPRVTTFNGTKNYTLSGTGSIGGTGTLVKSGTGTLTLSPAYFSLASTTTVGSASVTLASTASLAVGMTVEGNGIPAGTTILSIPAGGTTLTLSQNATAANTNVSFNYYAKNTFSGGTFINAGSTIVLANDTANAYGLGTGPITFNGGTLKMYDNFSTYNAAAYTLVVPAGQVGTLNADSRVDLYGTLSGGGIFNFVVPSVRTTLFVDWSAFTGIINVTGGGNFRLGTSYSFPGFPLATVNLGASVGAYYTGTISGGVGTTVSIGELSGPSSASLLGGATGGRNFTYRIGGRTAAGSEVVFTGSIGEQSAGTTTALVKTGAGVWTLGGPVTLNGSVSVEQGTLKIANALTCGVSLEVPDGAALSLAGGSVTTDAVNVAASASLTGSGTINGDLNNSGTVTSSSGQLNVTGDVVNDGTMRFTGGSSLNATGAFVNNGVLDLITGGGGLPPNLVNNGVVLDSSAVTVQGFSRTPGAFTLKVASYSGHNYQLQRADSLSAPITWAAAGSAQAGSTQADGTPATLTFVDASATGSQAFYRILVSP